MKPLLEWDLVIQISNIKVRPQWSKASRRKIHQLELKRSIARIQWYKLGMKIIIVTMSKPVNARPSACSKMTKTNGASRLPPQPWRSAGLGSKTPVQISIRSCGSHMQHLNLIWNTGLKSLEWCSNNLIWILPSSKPTCSSQPFSSKQVKCALVSVGDLSQFNSNWVLCSISKTATKLWSVICVTGTRHSSEEMPDSSTNAKPQLVPPS